MINDTIDQLKELTQSLYEAIKLDIVDVKSANHESLLERNSIKLNSMEQLSTLKQQLNSELSNEFQNGTDISIYKNSIDELEIQLRDLYHLNGKLASIVLPVKEMYKDIIDEITAVNGGSLIEVMA